MAATRSELAVEFDELPSRICVPCDVKKSVIWKRESITRLNVFRHRHARAILSESNRSLATHRIFLSALSDAARMRAVVSGNSPESLGHRIIPTVGVSSDFVSLLPRLVGSVQIRVNMVGALEPMAPDKETFSGLRRMQGLRYSNHLHLGVGSGEHFRCGVENSEEGEDIAHALFELCPVSCRRRH